ncbi:hypothetical protein Q4Q35_03220 [Flavivirga aquimarina]|uniref:Peptidase C51 domain-containing protein n=1 Tax=Flavivirga aquimarina TaxID=2027862 RepID=A0ABT8W6S9_9FLAO|nr:hypothetical protein [Flavivirga aquimarina]MDO5968806.1 hypothetical protein [Flavivirga aquimarina]
MKRIVLTLIVAFFYFLGFSQTDGITYQAVIIDNNPQEIPGVDIPANNLPNTDLQVRFTIVDDTGSEEYQETHNTTTDPYGMINLVIGKGTPLIGAFDQVYWNNSKYLRVEIDLNNGDGMVEFSYQELTYIPYVRHREIVATSTLDVDGDTNLNSNFTVNNQSPTYLTGDLTVDGLVAFDGPLEVGGDTQLYADLTVDGITNLNNNLFVNNGATTNLSGDLIVQGTSTFQDGNFQNITVAQNSNLNGRVVIDVPLTGGQGASTSYPLEVRGGNQGIWIDVNGGRNSTKNFITFSDASGEHGAVEGQTLSELQNSFRYIWDAAQALAEELFVLAEGVACAGQLDFAEAIVMGVEGANAYANLIELVLNAENNVGVSFKTGGADYAEWLPKKSRTEQFYPGEIVGVKGGYISKQTDNVDHIMVISTNPIVLGNSKKRDDLVYYEKVAFLGQVPVRVIGKVKIGDYILPSGNGDGLGIAKSTEEMGVLDYRNILGVAWEESKGEHANEINVAIGINANDISEKVAKQGEEIAKLKTQMQQVLAMLNQEEVDNEEPENNDESKEKREGEQVNQTHALSPLSAKQQKSNKTAKRFSEVEFDEWLEEYGYIFEEKVSPLRAHFEKAGIDLSKYPEIKDFFENPKKILKDMHSGNYLPSLWESLEKRYPNALKK